MNCFLGPVGSYKLQRTGKNIYPYFVPTSLISSTTGLLQEGGRQRVGSPKIVQNLDRKGQKPLYCLE